MTRYRELPEMDAWRQLIVSKTVREQQVAFTCATGVPLTLASASELTLAEGVYCVTGCMGGHSGELCRAKLVKVEQHAVSRSGPVRYCCPSGLMKIVVPVFIAGRHTGSMLAGPFAIQTLDHERLGQLAEVLRGLRLDGREEQLRIVWKCSPQLASEKCQAAEALLQIFARYLEETGKQFLQSPPAQNSGLLKKIEGFLAEGRGDQVSLTEVAARVNLSPCHFCSVFKKQTGITFNQYRMRQRLERSRELLDDRGRRISEIAFESGFESIPYFNRVFRRRFGCSPTELRRRLTRQDPGHETQNPGVAGNRVETCKPVQ